MNSQPNVQVEYNPPSYQYVATDRNSYDGAPDSNTKIHGWGDTPEEATEDLLNQLYDAGVYTK